METIPEAQAQTQTVDNVQAQPVIQPSQQPDLVTRVSQFKPEAPKVTAPVENIDEKFDVNDINKITDPQARAYADKAYKSFQRGFNQKFQELAETRKQLESMKNEQITWTPERIKQELNNPTFVQAAQVVSSYQNPTNSGLTDQEFSALSESEKAQLTAMKQEITSLKQQNMQALLAQQDEQLKGKYSNYNPGSVDALYNDMLNGKVQATREHLWKVMDYDDAVKRAYELGKQDRNIDTTQKINSVSIQGTQTTRSPERGGPVNGESTSAYFRRIAIDNLARARSVSQR